MIQQSKPVCPKCGNNDRVCKAGKGWSGLHKIQLYKCLNCGKVIYGKRER